jgi:hypothetical protein
MRNGSVGDEVVDEKCVRYNGNRNSERQRYLNGEEREGKKERDSC